MAGDTGQCAAPLKAAACHETYGLKANRGRIVDRNIGPVTLRAELNRRLCTLLGQSDDVAGGGPFCVQRSGAVAAFAGHSGLHRAQVRPVPDSRGVAGKAAGNGCRILGNSQSAHGIGCWRAWMAQGSRSVAWAAIPGDPMLEESAVIPADRSDCLRARSECPLELRIRSLLSLGDGDTDSPGAGRI